MIKNENYKEYFSLRNRLILTVYIFSFLACFFCGVKAVGIVQKNLLDNAYKTALNEQFRIGYSIKKMAESHRFSMEEEELYLFGAIRNLAVSYSEFYGDGAYYRITGEEAGTIYSNIPDTYVLSMPLNNKTDGTVTYVMERVEDKEFVFVSSYIKIYQQIFKLEFIQDVSGLKETQNNMALRISIAIFIIQMILLGALHLTISRALQPLESLGEKTAAIARGNYGLRAGIVYNDEVGRLAVNFNQMTEAVEKHIEQLRETAQMKEIFASDLAHEIRTPITSIVAYADYLAKYETEKATYYEILEYIKKEGLRIGELAEKILSWTSLNQNALIEKKPCRPESILKQAMFTLEHYMRQRGQKIETINEIDVILGNEALLISLIVNLCKNALNASEDNGIIKLSLKRKNESLLISVKDNGTGIEAGELKKIMEPFYMVDKARDRSKGGAGLGLPLCKTIVNVHGGSMDIQSNQGKGTCVTILIPQ